MIVEMLAEMLLPASNFKFRACKRLCGSGREGLVAVYSGGFTNLLPLRPWGTPHRPLFLDQIGYILHLDLSGI